MRTLHIAPGDSAGGSLLMAIRNAGRDDEVLRFRDDLSCGPIASNDAAARASWWEAFYDASEVEATLRSFWDRAISFEGRLIVWFGRHSASELAFFHAWADRMTARTYDIVDVTGRQVSFRQRDGSFVVRPAPHVSILRHETLQSLFGTERPITAEATAEPRTVARVVGDTMGHNAEPYCQVGDLMLQARVAALAEAGKLLAEGDPWDMRSRVRLRG